MSIAHDDSVAEVIAEVRGGPEPDWDAMPYLPPPDVREATRLVYRYHALANRIAVESSAFDAEIRALAEAKEYVVGPLRQRLKKLETSLALWHQARLAEDPAAKTIPLPTGVLASSAAQDEWKYDDATFLAWAKEHAQGAIRIPKPKPVEVAKDEARKLLAPKVVKTAGAVVVIDDQAKYTFWLVDAQSRILLGMDEPPSDLTAAALACLAVIDGKVIDESTGEVVEGLAVVAGLTIKPGGFAGRHYHIEPLK